MIHLDVALGAVERGSVALSFNPGRTFSQKNEQGRFQNGKASRGTHPAGAGGLVLAVRVQDGQPGRVPSSLRISAMQVAMLSNHSVQLA